MATMIGVLKDGKLVEEAKPKTLFQTPKHAYTKMLLKSAPNIDAQSEFMLLIIALESCMLYSIGVKDNGES